MLPIPMFQTTSASAQIVEATLWSFGSLGGYVIVPINYTGSTFSGRRMQLGTTGSGTYSASTVASYISNDTYIFNNGNEWDVSPFFAIFGDSFPTIDPTSTFAPANISMNGKDESSSSEIVDSTTINYSYFVTDDPTNDPREGPVQETGPKNVLIFNFKANTKIALW